MGQRANSGRQASLDDKKERAQGRQQNDEARQAITDRQNTPPVGGASGKDAQANRHDKIGGFTTTGDQSGGSGGAAAQEVDQRIRKSDN
jgi:hypothetical protein